jgi:NitT/TauT family transport system substrate-binding protein
MNDRRGAVSRSTFLGAGAALAAASGTALAQTVPRLIIGASTIDGATGMLAAQHNGFFRRNGVDVEIAVNNGAANAAAVAGGSIQLAASNIVTLIKAHLNGLPFQIVAPSSTYASDNPTQVLIVRNDSGIRTASDLNGKTVAVTAIGDVLSASTLAWIDQNGGTSSTVKLVELPPAAEAAALDAGRIQAAALAEPFLSQALSGGAVRVFAKIFDAIAPRFLQAAYFGTASYINANADIVQRFARALIEGNVFANAHPDQTLPWLIEYAKIDPAVARRARRERFGEAIDPSMVQVEIDALVRLKIIERGFDAREMFSPVVLNMRKTA